MAFCVNNNNNKKGTLLLRKLHFGLFYLSRMTELIIWLFLSRYICLIQMQLLLREKVSLSFVACAYENRQAKKNVCNACGRYKEIWPAQQPIKSLVQSLLYNRYMMSQR